MSKPIHIFKISRHYTRCEIWHGSRTFLNRLGTSVLVPDKGLTRKERYTEIAKWLWGQHKIPAPSYRPLKSEKAL